MSVSVPRTPRPQHVLRVIRTFWLSPHLVRVVVGGDGFTGFESSGYSDQYVKIYFAKPELHLTPPYDLAALRKVLDPADLPMKRTYTVRWINSAAGELAIDFVVHGDEGLAGPWAAHAVPGDTLVFSGPGGKYVPDPDAHWHLLAGDASALPAIAATLEAMPTSAVGHAFIEVDTEADRLPLTAPSGMNVTWLCRNGLSAQESGLLADAVAALTWRIGRVQVFAHGERESMKRLRAVFTDKGVDRSQLSLSGYWAYGRAEDSFQAEKRQPVGRIFEN